MRHLIAQWRTSAAPEVFYTIRSEGEYSGSVRAWVGGYNVGSLWYEYRQDEDAFSDDDDVVMASKGDHNGYYFYIESLRVDREHRRQGIATGLLRKFLDEVVKYGGFANAAATLRDQLWDPGGFTADGSAFWQAVFGEAPEVTMRMDASRRTAGFASDESVHRRAFRVDWSRSDPGFEAVVAAWTARDWPVVAEHILSVASTYDSGGVGRWWLPGDDGGTDYLMDYYGGGTLDPSAYPRRFSIGVVLEGVPATVERDTQVPRGTTIDLRRLYVKPSDLDGQWRDILPRSIRVRADRSQYGGQHAPSLSAPPLHDLTGGDSWLPDDVYTHPQFYGFGDPALTRDSARVIHQVRGKPDAMVTIYRSVPGNVEPVFHTGDWVALSRGYADQHGLDRHYDVWVEHPVSDEHPMGGVWESRTGWTTMALDVPAREVRNGGNDIIEWGYFGPSRPGRVL